MMAISGFPIFVLAASVMGFSGEIARAQSILVLPSNQPHEITVHKGADKRVTPDAERLAYAQRLYAADKYENVDEVTTQLLKESSPLASEAQFLRGKALFALGKNELTRQAYEWILLRHPDSQVVRDGRFTKTLSKAATYLLEKRQWREAGRYMMLLQRLDEREVALLGVGLERQLDRELSEFRPRSEGRLSEPSINAIDKMAKPINNCTYKTCYVENDEKCQAAMDEALRKGTEDQIGWKAKSWHESLDKWFIQQRKAFANQVAADIQSYALLSQLVTEAELLAAITPSVTPSLSAPYVTNSYPISGSRQRGRFDFNNSPWEGKKVCIELDSSRLDDLARQLTLHFGRLDREALLRRLGTLIGLEKSAPKPVGPKL